MMTASPPRSKNLTGNCKFRHGEPTSRASRTETQHMPGTLARIIRSSANCVHQLYCLSCDVKVRVIKWKNVVDHVQQDKRMRRAFYDFRDRLVDADWDKPQDIVDSFGNSYLITCKKAKARIVFNVGRNRYRLIFGYNFLPNQVILYVKFVGTHSEYDKVNVCTVDMFKWKK